MQSKASILIVENEPLIAADVSNKLEHLGYRVPAIATEAEGAYSVASCIVPDLILMDINLDGPVGGIEAAAKIYSELHIPVVFLTAHDDLDTLRKAQAADPFGYLTKPADPVDLSNCIEIAIQRHQNHSFQKLQQIWLEAQLRSVGEGLIAASHDGVIRFISAEGERLLGVASSEVVGKSFYSTVPLTHRATGQRAEDLVRLAFLHGTILDIGNDYEVQLPEQNRRLAGELAVSKVGEEPIGVVFTFRDNTVERWKENSISSIALKGYEEDCARFPVQLDELLVVIRPSLQAVLKPHNELQVAFNKRTPAISANQELIKRLLIGLIDDVQERCPQSLSMRVSASGLTTTRRGLDGKDVGYARILFGYKSKKQLGTATKARRISKGPHKLMNASLVEVQRALKSLCGTAHITASSGWTQWEIDIPSFLPRSETSIPLVLPTVVLIERDAAVRELLCSHLSEHGYECLGARNAVEALSWCQTLSGQIKAIVIPESLETAELRLVMREAGAIPLLISADSQVETRRTEKLISQAKTIDLLFTKEDLRKKLDELLEIAA